VSAIAKVLSQTKHFKTEVDPQNLWGSQAEVAFVGRSNVGKSSLINAICHKKNMARSSQVPGKTRTINVYEVKPGRWIVDLPGYGFAVGLKNEKDGLGKIIEAYLNNRETLQMVFVIVDAVAGPTKLDMSMMNWLQHHSFPFSIVVSKIDKIASPKLESRKAEIAGQLTLNVADIIWVSSNKNIGISDLQNAIGPLLL
jgi:GTP-binding protein